MQLQRDTSLTRSALSGAYVALAVLSALSAVGCQDPDPPCNVYDVRGYWGRIPAEASAFRGKRSSPWTPWEPSTKHSTSEARFCMHGAG